MDDKPAFTTNGNIAVIIASAPGETRCMTAHKAGLLMQGFAIDEACKAVWSTSHGTGYLPPPPPAPSRLPMVPRMALDGPRC